MKKCPNCNAENHNSALYCHICGKKLKTKVNGWLICSIVFFISTILMSVLTFNYADDVEYYSYKYHTLDNMLQEKDEQISNLESELAETEQFQNRIDYLTKQINEKAEEIERLENQTNDSYYLQNQINNLEAQLPRTYYTKYDNQNLYNRTSSTDYEKASSYYPQKGTAVTIYTTSNGYGLTEWGWIPMNCLEKY